MSNDWRASKLQREAVDKRALLAALTAYVERLDAMLEEARSFEGHFTARIEALDRRLLQIVDQWGVDGPYQIRRASPENVTEVAALQQQRSALERERDEEKARRTTTSPGPFGMDVLTFCELSSTDVSRKRRHAIVARDQTARELADVEHQLSPGELVQTGQPAPDFAEHRERVAALRGRIGAAS